ncbi:CMP-2-keto-3-deoxyoctulosonic acid synthetase [Algoriphagus iocasae]|uniref:CMP-2-keto-3-deoxyoctulosonic acid synthetase n=1 Tax=Algoriphagus iocasae TaxID=1836499 RepID=A0A841MZQ2_9BACT|nr:CMP-2-keto-3-deoxyoctulosonic acid synthetase [Algoriphagus iocasae]
MPEQLRLVENGLKILMVETVLQAIAIDSTEDLTSAEAS